MDSNVKFIQLDVGLDDLEELSFLLENGSLWLLIKNWELKMIKFLFSDVDLFVRWPEINCISEMCINRSSISTVDSLICVDVTECRFAIKSTTRKLVQFVNADKIPCAEIGCMEFSYEIYKREDELYFSSEKMDSIYPSEICVVNSEFSECWVDLLRIEEPKMCDDIKITARTSAGLVVEWEFVDSSMLVYRSCQTIRLVKNQEKTPLFFAAIERAHEAPYDQLSFTPKEQLYQFINSAGEPCIEIVCVDVIYRQRT
jgi:hypothetical protein